MSEHLHYGHTVRVVRRERLSGDGGKYPRYQEVVQLRQYRVEVVERFLCVFDDSCLGWKRHGGSLSICETRSPILKTQIGRIQTPLGCEVSLVPYLPCGSEAAQRRRLLN